MNRAIRVTREAIERRSEARSEAAQRQADVLARRPAANAAIIALEAHEAVYAPQTVTSAVSGTGATAAFDIFPGSWPRRFFVSITGTGAVSATVELWGTNAHDGDTLLMTFSLSGTNSDSADGWVETAWSSVWVDVTAISGTGAAVAVTSEC